MRIISFLPLFLPFCLFARETVKTSTQYGFIENKGQIIDQHNNPNPAVKYLWLGGGLNVQLRANGFSYEVVKRESENKAPEFRVPNRASGIRHPAPSIQYPASTIPQPDSIFIHRVDVQLVGANPSPRIIPEGAGQDYINYYTTGTPEEGVTGVRHFREVLYKDIYPHIDLEFLADSKSEHGFKYNFLVRPGGKVSDIRLKYKGAEKTELTKNGELKIRTAYGEFSESIPLSYEEVNEKPVLVYYKRLGENTYGFVAASYDQERTLVVDPLITYYGGANIDHGSGIASDPNGNYVTTGWTTSLNNISMNGSIQSNYEGLGDAFVVKFDNTGTRLWATYYGGTEYDGAEDITIDSTGSIYIGGTTRSFSNIATALSHQPSFSGNNAAFLVKFDSSGIRQWGTYYGASSTYGIGATFGIGVCLDTAASVFLAGRSLVSAGIATNGSFQPVYGGGDEDAFLVKFDSSGVRLWGTYFGGTDNESGYSAACDLEGNVIMTGETMTQIGLATPGAHKTSMANTDFIDGFIVKFSPSGGRIWSTYFGGDYSDEAYDVTVDGLSNIFVVGRTESLNGIAGGGAYQGVFGGYTDAFLLKTDSQGTPLWSTYVGGTEYDASLSVATDIAGSVYLTGFTESINDIATTGAFQSSLSGGVNAFLMKYNNSGQKQWGTFFGNDSSFGGYVGVGGLQTVAIVGDALTPTSISTTPAAHQPMFGGGFSDAFIAVFDVNGGVSPLAIANNQIGNNQQICFGAQPSQLSGSLPSGGTGTYQYLWLQSATSATSGFSPPSGTNNQHNYQPPILNVTTWYKRVVSSGSATDTSAAVMITVNALPVAIATATGPTTFCQGSGVQLNANTGTGISYQWLLNGAAINGATNSSYSAAVSGDYTVIVANSNNCEDTSAITAVTVFGLPPATITPQGSTTFCQGATVQLDANTGVGLSYQWLLNNTAIAGATNSSYTTGVAGDYSVVVTNTNNCSDTSMAVAVTVNALPSATVTPAGPIAFCQGGSVTLLGNTGTGLSYQWLFYNGAIPGATNDSYIAAQSGDYNLVVTNAANCFDTSALVQVAVYSLPAAFISFTGNDTICQGDTVMLQGTPGAGFSFQWRLNGSDIPGATNPAYPATVSGSYSVMVTFAGCDSVSAPVLIAVLPLPVPLITHAGTTVSTGSFISYQWLLNGSPIPGAMSQTLNLLANGTYSVKVTDSNGCEGSSADIVITDVGIRDQAQAGLQVYPNPANGEVRITSSTRLEGKIMLRDATGKVLITLDMSDNSVMIDLSPYASGVYLLEYAGKEGAAMRVKLVRK